MTDCAANIKRSVRSLVCAPWHRLLNAIDPPVIVLLYHRVTTLPSDPEMLAVTPDNFRAQLRYLKERYPVVRFADDWSTVTKPAVAITFDDGYADNVREALPILEELAVPATFFITTGTIDTCQEFWWHELERIILLEGELPATLTLDGTRSLPTGTEAERLTCYQEVVRLMTNAGTERREALLTDVRIWGGTAEAADTHRPLSLHELRCLAASPWATIGAHTVNHTRLASLLRSEQQEEIVVSREHLETWTSKKISVFSYPYGRRCDYTSDSVTLCKEAGFVKAAANFPGQAHRWTDPYRIPRHLVRNWTVAEFAARLEGFWTR